MGGGGVVLHPPTPVLYTYGHKDYTLHKDEINETRQIHVRDAIALWSFKCVTRFNLWQSSILRKPVAFSVYFEEGNEWYFVGRL